VDHLSVHRVAQDFASFGSNDLNPCARNPDAWMAIHEIYLLRHSI
jgi:hypothetical protein